MNYPTLKAEIEADPIALGYAGKTDQQIADLLNSLTTSRTLARTHVETWELLGAITTSPDAWPAVASISESKLRTILGLPFVDASNTNVRAMLGAIFPNSGNTATTRTNLLALGSQTVSRATELGLEAPTAVDVNRAKAGVW